MSILKTNSAVGAYKAVAEWIKGYFDISIDQEMLEKHIALRDDTYDVLSSITESWNYKWSMKKLIFKGDQSIQIPVCFSQSFLDRIETIELNDHSKFDPDQVKGFPTLKNLKSIHCVVSARDDIYSFLNKICHMTKRIIPERGNIVSVTICGDDGWRTTIADALKLSRMGAFEFYDLYNGKIIKTKTQRDVKASIVQCNNTIIKYLHDINIENLNELEVCADYFISGAIPLRIDDSTSLNKLVIRPLCTRRLERKYSKESYPVSIINLPLQLLDIPDDFPINIINSNISGLKGLLDRCSRIHVDNRSIIKSGLGVSQISSHAIDMFGNFIHPNDIVAIPSAGEIKWYKVIDTGYEEVSIIALLSEGRKSEFRKSIDLLQSYNEYCVSKGVRIEKIKIDGKITEAYVENVSDKSCWKIDMSFLEKSDINKFYDESIQLLKHDVSFVSKDQSDDQEFLDFESYIDKIKEDSHHFELQKPF